MCSASSRAAAPRWLIAFFLPGSARPLVLSSPAPVASGMKAGSYPKPPSPRGSGQPALAGAAKEMLAGIVDQGVHTRGAVSVPRLHRAGFVRSFSTLAVLAVASPAYRAGPRQARPSRCVDLKAGIVSDHDLADGFAGRAGLDQRVLFEGGAGLFR